MGGGEQEEAAESEMKRVEIGIAYFNRSPITMKLYSRTSITLLTHKQTANRWWNQLTSSIEYCVYVKKMRYCFFKRAAVLNEAQDVHITF